MNWTQLKTILWLRWRLNRNQWRRRGTFNAVLSALAIVIGAGAAVTGLTGGFLLGFFLLAKASPDMVLIMWDGVVGVFLFLWMLGVLTELQRSETIDLGRL